MDIKKDFDLFRKDKGISATALYQYEKTIGGYINPTIIEERQLNVAQLDVFSRLMMDRVIFLGTVIDDTVGNIITAQLLYLHSVDNSTPINLYISSPGGSCTAGLQIWDTMDFIEPDVITTVAGMAASMAFILSVSGKKRYALKNARLMSHQPSGGATGVSMDIEIATREIVKIRKILYDIISDKTKQPYDKVFKDCERDYWMSAQEALEYGAIDEIIQKIKK
jgi:ATP-dependent Clp protease protease subunit